MITQVTKGIKVSVKTSFEGTFFKNYKVHYAFRYTITIENLCEGPVKLYARHWDIFDALKEFESFDGEGVIGLKPVIRPKRSYSYKSGCLLASPIGTMKGYYNMMNLGTSEKFKVIVPSFKLVAPFVIN